MKRLALVVVVAAGCVPATGTILEVQGPMGMTSTAAGVATLELVVAHTSWCDRWVQDGSASRTRADVRGRDLDKRPYDFLVAASHQTDLAQPVYLAVLAYDASGQLLGEATFGTHPFNKDQVLKRQARIALLPATARGGNAPGYVASDGCVCVPGEPWLGTATGQGCDPRVITSFDRLADTAGCELTPKGAPLPVPVCDGQQYMDEPTDRDLPCWAADAGGTCRMTMRHCVDHDGVAWGNECQTDGGDAMVPSGGALCTRYRGCESACGDVTGCFEAAFGTPLPVACVMHVKPTTPGDPIAPCNGKVWRANFPGQQNATVCFGAVVQGVQQPPFTLGFDVMGGVQPMTTTCPFTLQIDAVDAPYPMAIPNDRSFDFVLGDHLVRVTMTVDEVCPANPNEGSMSCRPGP